MSLLSVSGAQKNGVNQEEKRQLIVNEEHEQLKKWANEAIIRALDLKTIYALEQASEEVDKAMEFIDQLPDTDPQWGQFVKLIAEIRLQVSLAYGTIDQMIVFIKSAANNAIKGQNTHLKKGVFEEITALVLPNLKLHWDYINSSKHALLQQRISVEISHNLELVTTCCFWDGGRRLEENNTLSQQSEEIISSFDSRNEAKALVNG